MSYCEDLSGCLCAGLGDGAVAEAVVFVHGLGCLVFVGVGRTLGTILSFVVWDSDNGIGAAGARDIGAAFAAGGLSQLTSLDMSCKN